MSDKQFNRRAWKIVVGVVLGILVVAALGGACGRPKGGTVPPDPTTTPTSAGRGQYTDTVPTNTPLSAPSTSAAPVPQVLGYDEGVYEVGSDIKPGKYKSPGPSSDGPFSGCYYARLKTGDGSSGDIIANNSTKGQSVVTIKPTDGVFETNGCLPWELQ